MCPPLITTGIKAFKALNTFKKFMVVSTALSTGATIKGQQDAKSEAKKSRQELEMASIADFDARTKRPTRVDMTARKRPGRRGLYV